MIVKKRGMVYICDKEYISEKYRQNKFHVEEMDISKGNF